MLFMWIQELDPDKFYAVVIENEHARTEDLERVAESLKRHGSNVVVLTDNSRQRINHPTYFGLYCEQCGTWWSESSGRICFYPAPELANAHLNDSEKHSRYSPIHKWKVQEFGKEEQVEESNLPNGTTVCPVLAARIREMRD